MLICSFTYSPLVTATNPAASPTKEAFNTTLRHTCGKSTPRPANGVRTLVIDAGHGGRDPGGQGRNCNEKDIALNVARLLGSAVRANFPNVRVVLTREDDTFVPLLARAKIANDLQADLFISIHANIADSRGVSGTETFVMGNHVAGYNLEVAKRENGAMRFETADGSLPDFDPRSDAGHILHRAQQGANQEHSIAFAGAVENSFRRAGRRSRGVKQAGFIVLKATTMPAVLVELGFMSNGPEENYLTSGTGQRALAGALLNAFTTYHAQMGGGVREHTAKRIINPQAAPVTNHQWKADGVDDNVLTYVDAPQADKVKKRVAAGPAASELTIGLQLAATTKPIGLPAEWDNLAYPVTEHFDGKIYRYQIRGFRNGREVRAQATKCKAGGISCVIVAYDGKQQLFGRALTAALKAK